MRIFDTEKKFYYSGTAIVGLLVIPFIIKLGFVNTNNSDLIFYSVSAKMFAEQLFAGEVYPRWLYAANNNTGAPVFLVYAPLSFYITAIISKVFYFLNDKQVILLSISFSFATCLVTSYKWSVRHLSHKNAVLFSMLLTFSPYMIIEMLIRVSIGECWSISLIPVALISIDKLVTTRCYLKWLPICGMVVALIALTHILSFVITSILIGLYWLTKTKDIGVSKSILCAFITYILAVLLASVYILPAILGSEYINVEGFIIGKYYYKNSFPVDVYSVKNNAAVYFAFFGCFLYIPAVFSLLSAYLTRGESLVIADTPKKRDKLNLYAILCIFVSIFMMNTISTPVWEYFAFLQKIQFPWRFCIVSMFSGSLIITLHLLYHDKTKVIHLLIKLIFIISLVIALVQFATDNNDVNTSEITNKNILVFPEWSSRYNPDKDWHQFLGRAPLQHIAEQLNNESATIESKRISPRKIEISTNSTQDFTLKVNQYYFPAWKAYNHTLNTHIDVSPIVGSGLIQLILPEGQNNISLELGYFNGEEEGIAISAITSLALLLCLIVSFVKPYCSK